MHKKILRLFQKRYLAFVMLVVIAFAVFGEMYHVLILSNLKVMTISLDYPGVEEGLNPDGSRFVISEMTNDEILDAAKSGLKIESKSNDEIRQRLFITTKFSQKEMDAVVSDIRDGMQGSYVPTTFHIYYSQENKFAKNETYEFLNALAEIIFIRITQRIIRCLNLIKMMIMINTIITRFTPFYIIRPSVCLNI